MRGPPRAPRRAAVLPGKRLTYVSNEKAFCRSLADGGPYDATGETPCLTFTTSGTTGGPKLVLHDQQAIAGHATDVARRIGLDAADAALLAAPPFCGTF